MGIDNHHDAAPMWIGTGKPDVIHKIIQPLSDADLIALSPEKLLTYLEQANKQKASPELFSRQTDILAKRFMDLSDMMPKNPDLADPLADEIAYTFGQLYKSKSCDVNPDTVERLYDTVMSPGFSNWEAKSFLGLIERFDRRNQKRGERFVDIHGKYSQKFVDDLLHPKTSDALTMPSIMFGWNWPFETGLRETLIDILRRSPDDATIRRIFPLYADRFELSEVKKYLDSYAAEHTDFRDALVHANNVLGFDNAQTFEDLDSTYTDMGDKFIDYEPNKKLIAYEKNLLSNIFPKGSHLLDVGFGPGARHMKALQDTMHVTGIDVVPSNLEKAQKHTPALDVSLGDWHHLDFPDNSFDGAYCLGRSILHNTTLDDWLQTLRELRRVSRGNVIVDTPDITKGSYATEVSSYTTKARSLGIHQYERGAIHDSPDEKHFLDRHAPSAERFKLMAKICGFSASVIDTQVYDEKGNVNVYWKLVPDGTPMTYQQYMAAYGRELTSAPVVTIDVSRKGY